MYSCLLDMCTICNQLQNKVFNGTTMTTEVNQKLVTDSKSCSLLLHLIYIFWCHIEQKREMTGYEHS